MPIVCLIDGRWFNPEDADEWKDTKYSSATREWLYRTQKGNWIINRWSGEVGGEEYESVEPGRAVQWFILNEVDPPKSLAALYADLEV